VLAWQGFKLSQATLSQVSPALGLPMGYSYLGIPVGATIMTLQLIRNILQKSNRLKVIITLSERISTGRNKSNWS